MLLVGFFAQRLASPLSLLHAYVQNTEAASQTDIQTMITSMITTNMITNHVPANTEQSTLCFTFINNLYSAILDQKRSWRRIKTNKQTAKEDKNKTS